MTRSFSRLAWVSLLAACGDDGAHRAPDATVHGDGDASAAAALDASLQVGLDAAAQSAGDASAEAGAGSCVLGDRSFPDGAQVAWTDGCNVGTCDGGRWSVTLIGCVVETPQLNPCRAGDVLVDDQLAESYREGNYLVVDVTGSYCASGIAAQLCRDETFAAGDMPSVALHVVQAGRAQCQGKGVAVQLDDLQAAAKQQFPGAASITLRVGQSTLTYPL